MLGDDDPRATEDLISQALDEGIGDYRIDLPHIDEETGEVLDEIQLREYLLDRLEDE